MNNFNIVISHDTSLKILKNLLTDEVMSVKIATEENLNTPIEVFNVLF